ncbi:MAG: PAS domain-containing protein, partial [Terriglobia bacterium]
MKPENSSEPLFGERRRRKREGTDLGDVFRLIAEESPNMTIVVGKDEVLYVNRVCADVMGYSKEEFYERDFDFKALVASEQREKVAANIMKRLKGGDPPPEDFRLLAKGGREIIVIPSTKVVEFAGQKAVLGILTDVTRRRASEERLRESEARYQGLFESSPVGLIEADLSMVKAAIDELTRQGVDDFGEYFRNNPERLANVFLNMKPLGVNNAFLELYGMQSVAELSEYLARSRFAGWQETLENLCIAMARGEKEAQGKGVSETSRGEELNLRLQGTVVR